MEDFCKQVNHSIIYLNSFLAKENISENEMNDVLQSVNELCHHWTNDGNIFSNEVSLRISNLYLITNKKVEIKVPFWLSFSRDAFGFMAQEKNQTEQFKEQIKSIRNELSSLDFLVKWEN